MAAASTAAAADQIRIVSSSTVFPFASAVAEHFSRQSGFKSPVVESIGSGGGFKAFCRGLGEGTPDIATASRLMTPSERNACAASGVTEIAQIPIGRDGIVIAIAKSAHPFPLTRRQLFLALARRVPLDGRLTANPARQWYDIDPQLPRMDILIYGPGPNHGTRDVLVEMVMEPACAELPVISGLDEAARKAACEAIREDGAFVDVSETYSVLLRRVAMEPRAIGILPFSYVDQNTDKVQSLPFEGERPTYEAVLAGRYALSRPLFVYVKKDHLGRTPGLRQYIAEFTSEKAWGKDGYLSDLGLIPLPDSERRADAARVRGVLGEQR
jgi:phosphate transport system substrate-binding protein